MNEIQYIDRQPDDVSLTKAHHGLGEALLSLSETQAAQQAFQQAASSGINSIHAHRAQARLNEMGG